MTDEDFQKKLNEAFAIEAAEHLQAITTGLLELEKTPPPLRRKEIIETTFREAHSLKGAARAVNRTDIEAVCQAMESLFSQWKSGPFSAPPQTFDTLNAALDFVTKLLTQPGVATAPAAREAVRAMSQRLAQPAASSAPSAPTAEPSAPITEPQAREPERIAIAETVRVPMAKLDELLRQAEEMVTLKLAASEHARGLRELGGALQSLRGESAKIGVTDGKMREFLEAQIRPLEKRLAQFEKAADHDERLIGGKVDDMLRNAKKLVMLPMSGLLDLFPKLVRDLAREQGKDIDFAIHGREVEIDKRILEEIKDALIHLVRNGIDHGLETPAVRTAQRKPPRCTLALTVAQRDASKVEITIRDDGAGIDAAAVKAAAVKNGALSEADAAQLSESAALALIFQSGVSTSPIITEISGRGLGMAIVREKVEKLGGQIAIETRLREGTTFRILLPVTLATFKGILVDAGGQTFVVPTSSVERIVRVKRAEIATVENRETISLDGQAVAFVWLADTLELSRREPAEPRPIVEALVLGATAAQRIAFGIEALHHEQEVLVKPLSKPLLRVRNIAAATVLGSGAPALILNVADLLQSAVRTAATGARKPAPAAPTAKPPAHRLLVVDDSVTSRMLLKNILESAGCTVTTAVDGIDALTALHSGEFDLVVTDVEMPCMDGFALTAKIRADERFSELPVVLVTALGSREDRERGIDAGASAYIVKSSFDQNTLLEVIRRLV